MNKIKWPHFFDLSHKYNNLSHKYNKNEYDKYPRQADCEQMQSP